LSGGFCGLPVSLCTMMEAFSHEFPPKLPETASAKSFKLKDFAHGRKSAQ
jgi:hypothetical protein